MGKIKKKKQHTDEVKIVPDSDVFSNFSKLKAARSEGYSCELEKGGSATLFKIGPGSKVLIAKKGTVDKKNIIRVNLDYPDFKILLMMGSFGSKLGELFDLEWKPLLYPHLQESWNERKRQRDVESGRTLL